MFAFGKKNEPSFDTVDSLIGDLQLKVDRLVQLSDEKTLESENIQQEIKELNSQKEEAEKEASRANSIADKIAALLG